MTGVSAEWAHAPSPCRPPSRALSPRSRGRAAVHAFFEAQAQAAARREEQACALAQRNDQPARPCPFDEPPPELPPAADALSPRSRARIVVRAHHERERQTAEAARRARQGRYSTERAPVAQAAPTRSSGGLPRASATGREVGPAGVRDSTVTVSTPVPHPSPPSPRIRPTRPPSHGQHVPVDRTCRPPPSPAPPAHRARAPPADAIQPARSPRAGAPSPSSDVRASAPRRHVNQPVRQAARPHANGAHDSARPAAVSRPSPLTTRETSSSDDIRGGRRTVRDHRAPGSLSSPASSSRADGPARANALLLDASDPPSSRKPASASVLLPRHSPDSRPPSRPFEQAALASVERDHRRLASPSFGVPASAPREHDGPPMCQAPHRHADGTLGKHTTPTAAPLDARASPDSACLAAASRPSLSTARKTSSSDNLRDGCRAVRDHRLPGSLPSSASSCRPVLVSTPRLSHPPDSLASVPPSRKEEPDLAGLDEELRRRIWQVRTCSRLVTEDSPESAAIANEEAALRREIWEARARARLAPRLV
ncbi:uncharacterized protein C8Q71DRAFT_904149 [Rhodofomes roseus]|uniref:Uncharacterized protein n=1 Tax=Rhodofomes roseus TaxID=34475 RepID=A0ABQ8KW17_9APHY|nr:uncharacterized protein C8Q71DRAFT_904149 [Rhodofomes roseus]KAH9843231.1 hypothetical protein C8Q71DRAFT_904149 [Rhodofomes roseus]